MNREDVARAAAYFEASDDVTLLHELVEEIAPRAKKMVAAYLSRGEEETIPGPADLRPAKTAASRDEALKTLRTVSDFPLLQVLARTIGRRIETIEITASAEFPEGARVIVPAEGRYPRRGAELAGEVESTGTSLQVLLDNGETWNGPPSLARREGGIA